MNRYIRRISVCQNGQGFTLIEILVVIAIVGILSTIILATIYGARTRANDTAVMSTVSSTVASVLLCMETVNGSLGVDKSVGAPICAVSGVGGEWPNLASEMDGWAWTVQEMNRGARTYTLEATNGAKKITCDETMNSKCRREGF